MNRTWKALAQVVLAAWAAIATSLALATPTVTYYHNDLAGSPVVATNASGQVIWRESYRPYGERLTNAPASTSNDIWFTSRRQDAETGLVYMGARYYDPVVGRFYSTDPAGFVEGNVHSFNRYSYGNNNPYRYSDPDGKNPIVIAILANAGGGALIGGGSAGLVNAAMQYYQNGTVTWGGAGGVVDAIGDGAAIGAVLGVFGAEYGGAAAGINSTARSSSSRVEGAASRYSEITTGRSVTNIATDVSRTDFEKNLLDAGWTRAVSKDGKVAIFEKDGASYRIRDTSNEGSRTAEYFKQGSERADLKIRLGE